MGVLVQTGTYTDFLTTKRIVADAAGFDADDLHPSLFPFQRDITRWALRKGRAAIFAGTGLGKTAMQLEWARQVHAYTGGDVLILAPLAVSKQTVREGEKFGIVVNHATEQAQVGPGITITNYERLHRFDPSHFTAIVLDESSILKSYTGSTRTAIIDAFARTPYRLACTATPAPNDFMELGNHAEFLGVMTRVEMLSMFFVHDGGSTQDWRLKGHAEADFWRWMSSWAVMLRQPSDLGYDDAAFQLPPLEMHSHTVESTVTLPGMLFPVEAQSLIERRQARKASVNERAQMVVDLVHAQNEAYNLRYEQRRRDEATGTQGIHAAVPSEEHRQVEANARATIEGERAKAGEVRTGFGVSRKHQGKSQGLVDSASREEEGGEVARNARDRSERLSGSSSRADGDVRDLRSLGYEQQELLSGRGPRSQDWQDSRTALYELQSGTGVLQGRYESPPVGSDVSPEKWVIWCDLNDEQRMLKRAFGPVAVSIEGSTPMEERERLEVLWREGPKQIMITKPSIFGWGLNWQHCRNVAFVGLSDSWEQYYQAIRRCWRFGQASPVRCHVISSTAEGAVVANIERKERDAERMASEMVRHMQDINRADLQSTARETDDYETATTEGRGWTIHRGDCVDVLRGIPDATIDYSIFSPPFASLYTYSNSPRDMGNCKTHAEFYEHFTYCVRELYRVLKPGRLLSFHCMNLPTSKVRDGVIGISDFRGDLIRMFQTEGFIYHSEVVIWKDPVTAMQRTKALGLLYKQLKKDSAMSRQGIPDYLVTMRKPGENPDPVTKDPDDFPVSIWQRYASPVWMDINPSDTLQGSSAREERDEKHIAPLQLEVIRRAVQLWTNPDDLVLSPFAGIGSEGVVSLEEGRRFVGMELKGSYFWQAVANLQRVEQRPVDLFSFAEAGTG